MPLISKEDFRNLQECTKTLFGLLNNIFISEWEEGRARAIRPKHCKPVPDAIPPLTPERKTQEIKRHIRAMNITCEYLAEKSGIPLPILIEELSDPSEVLSESVLYAIETALNIAHEPSVGGGE